jgi:hypothetical protein
MKKKVSYQKIKTIKTWRHNILLFLVSVLFLASGIILLSLPWVDNSKALPARQLPLLLSSGMVNSKQAEVNIIIWFDNGEIPVTIISELPYRHWKWEEKTYTAAAGQNTVKAVTLTGSTVIDNDSEKWLSTWYPLLAEKVKKAGGQAYLDERVAEGIDIAAFLNAYNALPQQWHMLGKTYSVTAWQESIGNALTAGIDPVNIQLVTRFSDNGGLTALSFPVLLKDF